MADFEFRLRREVLRPWVRYREPEQRLQEAPLRAGVAGAYLPRVLIGVAHQTQSQVSHSVPHAASMVLLAEAERRGQAPRTWMEADWLAEILGTDESGATPGKRLERLRAWGVRVEWPRELQFFRDGTARMNQRFPLPGKRWVYRWEERWLRCVGAALRQDTPAVLFVDLGRLYPHWRGLPQPHAVVLAGGDGRQAWIHDPAREEGPTRVGIGTLMDALLPGEPLAAFVSLSDGSEHV
jgi:hypothetical protein